MSVSRARAFVLFWGIALMVAFVLSGVVIGRKLAGCG